MKGRLQELGAGHAQIWFNEGWAYTNTAQDEDALALTNLNAAQSTNAMVASLAELTVTGQDKTIIFIDAYEDHGQSFWDYANPGQMLWDYNGYPLPLVGAWNTLIHHIGLSTPVAWVRPPGANACIFQDNRNARGVMIAYADRESTRDVSVKLPFAGAVAEDCMGNAVALPNNTLTLAKSGRPVFIYTRSKTPGRVLADKLAPLDRKNKGFVSNGATASYTLPPTWEGDIGTTKGNPALAKTQPIWKLSQIWPPDPLKNQNYRLLTWRDNSWKAPSDDFGDQPKAEMRDNGVRMEFRAASGNPQAERICALSFIAPKTGTYNLSGSVELKLWDGDVPVRLQLLRRGHDGAVEILSLPLTRDQRQELKTQVQLQTGDELVLVPRPGGAFTGGDITLRDITLRDLKVARD